MMISLLAGLVGWVPFSIKDRLRLIDYVTGCSYLFQTFFVCIIVFIYTRDRQEGHFIRKSKNIETYIVSKVVDGMNSKKIKMHFML